MYAEPWNFNRVYTGCFSFIRDYELPEIFYGKTNLFYMCYSRLRLHAVQFRISTPYVGHSCWTISDKLPRIFIH